MVIVDQNGYLRCRCAVLLKITLIDMLKGGRIRQLGKLTKQLIPCEVLGEVIAHGSTPPIDHIAAGGQPVQLDGTPDTLQLCPEFR